MDLFLLACQHILGRDVTDRAMQALLVINLHVLRNESLGVIQRKRNTGTNAFTLDGFIPAFQLAVRLRIEGAVRTWVIPEMRINSLKSLAMNCGPLSVMMRGFASGNFSRARCNRISTSGSHIKARKLQSTI